jgi:hypothetical protein
VEGFVRIQDVSILDADDTGLNWFHSTELGDYPATVLVHGIGSGLSPKRLRIPRLPAWSTCFLWESLVEILYLTTQDMMDDTYCADTASVIKYLWIDRGSK